MLMTAKHMHFKMHNSECSANGVWRRKKPCKFQMNCFLNSTKRTLFLISFVWCVQSWLMSDSKIGNFSTKHKNIVKNVNKMKNVWMLGGKRATKVHNNHNCNNRNNKKKKNKKHLFLSCLVCVCKAVMCTFRIIKYNIIAFGRKSM